MPGFEVIVDFKINPVSGLKGIIEVPGDKSISHRALFVGALAEGKTHVKNFLTSQDCFSTLRCLQMLGVQIEQFPPSDLEIKGVGFYGFKEPSNILSAGNSGTTLRILPGILAAQNFFSVLTGDDSLRKRPMSRIIEPLTQMGAKIWARGDNFAPVAVKGGPLHGISYITPVPSAQVKTALLLAGLLASGTTEIKENFKSRDHTERMLNSFGAHLEIENTTYRINAEAKLLANDLDIPGDISSAAFFIVGALITRGSELLIKNAGVNPTRTGFLELIKAMGAKIGQTNIAEKSGEPRADISIHSSTLGSFEIREDMVPSVIDELPILALLAAQSEGTSTVSGAEELRVKESDRIASICSELKKLGANITEKTDGFVVKGPTKLKGTVVESFGDHRLAMALSIAGLVADGTTIVKNVDCVQISFPGFLKVLKKVAH